MLGGNCEGCQYCNLPYTAEVPISGYGKKEFNSTDDIWDVIGLLVEEVKDTNMKTGKEFGVAESIIAQIPFFTCNKHIIDEELQLDIQRYIYCKDNSVSPYPGHFQEQPYIWVQKYFIIRSALAKLEKSMIEKSKQRSK